MSGKKKDEADAVQCEKVMVIMVMMVKVADDDKDNEGGKEMSSWGGQGNTSTDQVSRAPEKHNVN